MGSQTHHALDILLLSESLAGSPYRTKLKAQINGGKAVENAYFVDTVNQIVKGSNSISIVAVCVPLVIEDSLPPDPSKRVYEKERREGVAM